MILRGRVRPNDFVARYGGEEFVALCPNCDVATALQTAERIREGVADQKVLFRNSLISVTSSVGVATIEPPYPDDPQELLERADRSLYLAKSGGRNRVWYWDNQKMDPADASLFAPSPAEMSV